jgi:ribonuclease D
LKIKNNPEKFYITSQPHLQDVIGLIKEAKLVALDTEFTRQTTYYPILSIIQIAVKNSAGEQENFVVDCISDLDLSELFGVISDPKIIKILHSSTQDLQIFYHKSGLLPQGVIDTQIMANFCGFGFSVGYSNLVEQLFQKQLDKKQQRSDWQRRPLSKNQLEYALLDVIFLEEMHQIFLESLLRQNRLEWLREEMENFVQKILFKTDDNLSKNFSFRGRNAKQIAQIKSLVLWREGWARKVNVPRQHFLKDEVIEKIITHESVEKISDLTSEMREEINQILYAKTEIFDQNFKREKKFFMSESQKNSYQEAKKIIAKISVQENFSEQFLITSADIGKVICEKNFLNEKVVGWRYQLFGKELEQLIL